MADIETKLGFGRNSLVIIYFLETTDETYWSALVLIYISCISFCSEIEFTSQV